MLTRPLAVTLVAALTVGAAAGAQTPPTATPAAVEPAIAFGTSWGTAAGTHALALRSNGDVLTWGKNENCRLGRNTNTKNGGIAAHIPTVVMRNAKAIAAAGTKSLVLTTDGKVYSWAGTVQMGSGYFPCDGPAPVPSLAGRVVARIGLGPEFGVAVTDTGDLYCFGEITACPVKNAEKAFARLSIPGLDGNVLDVSVGGRHTLVLTKDRKLYAFGYSRMGQLGDPGFRPGGPGSDITRVPIMANVVSFAAGQFHSVAVKDDGTVWTWGSNGASELCDGTTAVKVVPTQLPALAGQAAQVAAGDSVTFIKTKAGALYACGDNQKGAFGLDPQQRGTGYAVPQPTQVPVPAIKSPVLALTPAYGAFSPDGCALYISGLGDARQVGNDGIRGATAPSSGRFSLRAGLSLCAPRSAPPMPDVDPGAFHAPPPAPPAGVDCWAPTREIGRDWKDPRFAPIRQAMATIERLLRENEAFAARLPERVRVITEAHTDGGMPQLIVAAFPRARWSQTACRVLGDIEDGLGSVRVSFNGYYGGEYFRNEHMTPSRYIGGVPVYNFPGRGGPFGSVKIEHVVISKDGKIPVVPVTLADRLDKEAQNLTESLEKAERDLAVKTDSAVEAIQRQYETDLRRQVEALRAYRASFSAEQLRAAWVQGDQNGPEKGQLDARVKALQALPSDSQVQVTDLGTRARALQRQVQTRGITPQEAARLRSEANDLLTQANAIVAAHRSRVAPEVAALHRDFELKLIRPGDASHASYYKDDPTFYDSANPGRIQLIALRFLASSSRDTAAAQVQAWMDQVMNTFDYAALKALIR
jgi:alpha-tubulin suppressor-like RCC1 family protein